MEKYPTVKVIWGRRYNKQTLDSPVEIEVYFARKRKWIATGIKSTSKNWNQDKWIIGRSDAVDANLAIENLLFKIQNYIRKLIINRESFNWSLFNTYLDSKENYESFIEFVEDSIKNKNDIRESTKINHRKLTTALREFGVINNFNDLTKANILKYDAWLHGRKNYTQSTIASYHKFLKIYINEALRKLYSL